MKNEIQVEKQVDLKLLEAEMLQLPQAVCPVIHHFGPGLYIRELHMTAGTIALGHKQRFVHMNVLVKGKVNVVQDDGTLKELCAPLTFVAGPGRKLGYVMEDLIWQNVYATEETDVDKLEEMFFDKSEVFTEQQKVISYNTIDNDDYIKMLTELDLTETFIRGESETTYDLIPMPFGFGKVSVRDSAIEGKGLFASFPLMAGEIIAPALINGKRTPAGRFTNHAKEPNAAMLRMDNGDVILVALFDIEGCSGGNFGEEITVDYRQALKMAQNKLEDNVCQV